ncbi:uncharacterized protein [Montipora capricornis]|uniref:uncharacterized protein isoform X2 n=1 Tax=Montipora capricornis TaxID=246305 RepID=UPI0035F204FF
MSRFGWPISWKFTSAMMRIILRNLIISKQVCFIAAYPVSDLCPAPLFIGLVGCFTIYHSETLQATSLLTKPRCSAGLVRNSNKGISLISKLENVFPTLFFRAGQLASLLTKPRCSAGLLRNANRGISLFSKLEQEDNHYGNHPSNITARATI